MWKASVGHKVNVSAEAADDWETDPDFVVSFYIYREEAENTTIDILCSHNSRGDYLRTVPGETSGKEYEAMQLKQMKWELHANTLAEYYRVKRIPRGLRMNTRPTLLSNNKIYCDKFEAILNKCSYDLIVWTVECLQTEMELQEVNIKKCKDDLQTCLSNDEFQEMEKRIATMIAEEQKAIKETKRAKFIRDEEDYRLGRVYRWIEQQRVQHRVHRGSKKHRRYKGKLDPQIQPEESAKESALGHEYKAEPEKHSSQTDASKGFGGKYGVQKDRTDKSAVGFEYKTQLQQHSSQQDHSQGFGGKFGVQKDRQDKSAHSWNYKEELQPHQSQTDYSQGFGGKFGVQKDRQDKSAHSWNHKEEIHPHQSQTDCAKGFGGRYGVQTDRVDKCASGFGDIESPTSAYQKTQPLEALTSGAQDLRSRFENIARTAEVENKLRAEEERVRRQKREKQELDHQHNNVPVVTPSECPAPVPRPRVSVFAAQEHAAPQITLDQEHEAPPVVPPKCFIVEEQFQPPPSEIFTDEAEYEAIPSPNNEIDEEYEAVPDLPPRAELEESETYEKILEAPVRAEDVLYEELQNSDAEAVMKGPSFQSGQVGATGISALAIYDYEGSGDDEISFQPADLITDIEMVDEGWWSGTCGGRRGLFPANYVQLVQ
ncbi:LOW QUALITY PROTEIN: hematopoietic lineage cell-specific protein-like [Bombina bombina]|uniref:LOW QUALITY PROTEIN: hematopoietic lineage cell-specific protein-like n=1 Tax=Bombina bombina TaxID=8345 RepID=UPI00235AC5E3|nr:LOW QUALITY PROTEIN: hematopoietic lineage cell-specific protein-like [Bombina bombina]